MSGRKLHPALGSVLLLLVHPAAAVVASAPLIYFVGQDKFLEPGFREDWLAVLLVAPWLVALPLLLGAGRWITGLDRERLGLGSPLRWAGVVGGLMLGILLLLLPSGLAILAGSYLRVGAPDASLAAMTGSSALLQLPVLAAGMGIAAFGEEVLCRGLLLRYWEPLAGTWGAITVSSIFFTAMHAANPGVSALGLIGVFLWGVLLGLIFVRSNSMLLVTGVHCGWNFATASILGLPVSGMHLDALSRWASVDSPTAQLLFGGAFGPEEGLAYHAVLVLAILVVWLRWGSVSLSE
jgi:hypothetical protein